MPTVKSKAKPAKATKATKVATKAAPAAKAKSAPKTKTVAKFVWYDAMTTDCKAAEKFYTKAIGWSAKDSGMPGTTYTLLSAGKTQVGGLMTIPDDARKMGVPPCWTGYIGVSDVDDYAARVVKVKGAIQRPPTDIPGVGRFAVVADPQGAVFILFKGNGEPMPVPAAGTPGHVGWHELMAGDLNSAWPFYAGLFGWTKAEAVDMGPMGIYQTFATGGMAVGGMMSKPPHIPQPCWQYYFNVEKVDAAVTRVKKGGGKIIHGPMQVPGGSWIANAVDPQGAHFSIVGAKKA